MITYEGAKEIMSTYLDETEYMNLPVSVDQGNMTVKKIISRDLMFFISRCTQRIRIYVIII